PALNWCLPGAQATSLSESAPPEKHRPAGQSHSSTRPSLLRSGRLESKRNRAHSVLAGRARCAARWPSETRASLPRCGPDHRAHGPDRGEPPGTKRSTSPFADAPAPARHLVFERLHPPPRPCPPVGQSLLRTLPERLQATRVRKERGRGCDGLRRRCPPEVRAPLETRRWLPPIGLVRT